MHNSAKRRATVLHIIFAVFILKMAKYTYINIFPYNIVIRKRAREF